MLEQHTLTRSYGVASKAPSVGEKPVAPPLGQEPRVVPRVSPRGSGQQAPDRPSTIKGMVIKTMEDHPETRNSYRKLEEALLHKYFSVRCKHCGEEVILSQEELEGRPQPESIRRRCQEIQHRGGRLIPTRPSVLEARGFFNECPIEKLHNDGVLHDKPPGYSKAVCRHCKKEGKIREEECPLRKAVGGLEEPHRVMRT